MRLPRHYLKLKRQDGFSLTELLIVLVLIFIIVALVSAVLISSENTSRDVISMAQSEMDARVALYRITKDLRETHNIIMADNDEIIFDTNVDADDYFEQVHYYLSADGSCYDLYRQVDSGTSNLLIKNIVGTDIFKYYTGITEPEGEITDLPITLEEQLKSIKHVNILVDIDQSGSPSARTMTLDTLITLRNRIY